MYEHNKDAVISAHRFYIRLFWHVLAALGLIAASLLLGMLGYTYFENMEITDAFLNASMILSGMGEVTPLNTSSGKIFAGLYAIYSGLLFITVLAIILIPVLHRVLHKFHIESQR